MTNITSSMSPGYLQINPYFNENASKLSRQNETFNENPMNSADKDVVASSHKSAVKDNQDKLDLSATSKEEADSAKSAEKDKSSDNRLQNKEDHKERAIIEKLKQREREVIAHEAAHMAVGGRFVGSPTYTRERGPDGRTYITGGEVPITVPSSSCPEETIRNMQQVRAAALAPANPSSQDINVAAAAANAQMQAEAELAAQKAEWGEEPQPVRTNFDATDRIPAEMPMVKEYRSAVNEEPDGAFSSINLMREEALSKAEADLARKLEERESLKRELLNHPGLTPEENLYNMRQAVKIYCLTSSPRGLWTVDNGFEEVAPPAELIQARALNIAA